MLPKVIEIAKEAGELIKNNFGKSHEIKYKTNVANIVTETDKAAEDLIIKFVNKNFPGHGILSEEIGMIKGTTEYLWVIDPLDGTTNFAHGLPIFVVSIAVLKNNQVIYGVVYDIMRNVVYKAEKGCGSFANQNRLSVSKRTDLAKCLLATGFPYDVAKNPSNVFNKFTAFLRKSRAVRRLGSAALDSCFVAEGIFDGFWEVSIFPWDILAGKLIIEEAGGLVSDFNGNKIGINTKQFLATNGLIHKDMMKILNEN